MVAGSGLPPGKRHHLPQNLRLSGSRSTVLGLILILILLSACSGGRLIYENNTAGILYHYAAAAADGEVGIVVLGASSEAVTETLRRSMEESGGYGASARYVRIRMTAARAEPHFVVMFDPPPTWTPGALCRVQGLTRVPPTGGDLLRFHIAFCSGGARVSQVEAQLPWPEGGDHPALERLVGQAMIHLVPYQDPQLEGSEGAFP